MKLSMNVKRLVTDSKNFRLFLQLLRQLYLYKYCAALWHPPADKEQVKAMTINKGSICEYRYHSILYQ